MYFWKCEDMLANPFEDAPVIVDLTAPTGASAPVRVPEACR
ncbi:hypothetical protein C725_0320 [Pacificimonas flava]|uniref:Uncharacterized protein n=1 Tax=Pacificimonas flava TaxID=1234595 RepID=M2SG97_9SPHN|nr:hypothetical protein C725_0320 [Pacificimonas flava]